MPFTAQDFQIIKDKSTNQVQALQRRIDLAARYQADPMTYSRQIHNKAYDEPLKKQGIEVDGVFWLYVKPVVGGAENPLINGAGR